MVDYSNASYPVQGNPNLNPEYNNIFSLRYNKFDFATGNVFFSNFNFTQTNNKIVANTVSFPRNYSDPKLAGTILTQYTNASGFYSASAFYLYAKPWQKRKYTLFINGNISYNKSSVIFASDPGNEITIPGLSKWVGSGELYYDKKGIQARVSYRFRSTFLGEVAGLSAAPTFRQVKAEGILDAQIGYEFQSGPLKGLSILAQAKNLTDRPFVTYQNDDKRQVIDYQRYGRDYYLGVAYKF